MSDPPRRRLSAAERRDELLDAASEVFARSGYHGASLDEIAAAAGVSKALIYEHFASKRELHAELVARHASEIFRRLQANAETGATGEERLRGGVDAFLSFVEQHREAWRALFRDAADPEVAEAIAGVRTQAIGVVAALMAAEPDRHESPQVTPDQRALFLEAQASLLTGATQAIANWWYEHQDVPRSWAVDRVMEFCWLGLERVSEGEIVRR
ncbi:MAG TPA: TetR/AcrR family transcriptional regulator [Solirubrobacteraceae bacterium]|nr:TetR/AcrR family transcriptional regulator [Solirubrobacteraceae bacterium]